MQPLRVPDFPPGRRWVRAVMATTLDGVVRGEDGGSRSISSAADQRWFSALRSAPDVLLVGAGTIRAEDYRPSRKVIAVVTNSLDLPMSLRMFSERGPEHPRPIVVTSEHSAATASDDLHSAAHVIGCGVDSVDLAVALDALAGRGLTRVQCEGGPRLLADLLADDLIDQLLLSVTPLLHGGEARDHLISVPGWEPRRLNVVDVQRDDDTVFLTLERG